MDKLLKIKSKYANMTVINRTCLSVIFHLALFQILNDFQKDERGESVDKSTKVIDDKMTKVLNRPKPKHILTNTCGCKVVDHVVGCCSHVTMILRYFGFARFAICS